MLARRALLHQGRSIQEGEGRPACILWSKSTLQNEPEVQSLEQPGIIPSAAGGSQEQETSDKCLVAGEGVQRLPGTRAACLGEWGVGVLRGI